MERQIARSVKSLICLKKKLNNDSWKKKKTETKELMSKNYFRKVAGFFRFLSSNYFCDCYNLCANYLYISKSNQCNACILSWDISNCQDSESTLDQRICENKNKQIPWNNTIMDFHNGTSRLENKIY